jgi:hypothetical protein
MAPHRMGKAAFASFFAQHPFVRIAALGPRGTSSDTVLRDLLQDIPPHRWEILLRPSFEQVYDDLASARVDYAMVPSAYTNSTRFYWSSEFRLEGAFVQATPDYHLALPPDLLRPATIAACDAVRHMIGAHFASHLPEDLTILRAESTVQSAEIVAQGRADACVTNEPGRALYGLSARASVPGVDMIWSVFSLRAARLHLERHVS